MTSAIVYTTVDEDFPVAGVDNDSQGFRDNFTVIKTGLQTANSEITTLQTYSAKLGNNLGTEVVNNFGGNIISNAKTSRIYANAYETVAPSNTNISWNDGEYQAIEMRGNYKLTFIDWPEADGYGKMRIELKSNGVARTVTFAAGSGYSLKKEIGTALVTVAPDVTNLVTNPGAVRNASTGPVETTQFSFPTASFTTITGAGFQVGNFLTGSGLTNDVLISAVDNITATATTTVATLTLGYNNIVTGTDTIVNMDAAPSSITNGDPITLPDVTGVGALSALQVYYVYKDGSSNIKLSTTKTPYTAILSSGTYTGSNQVATFRESASSNSVNVGDNTKMYVNMPIRFTNGSVISSVAIAGTSGQFTCTATTLEIGDRITISGSLGGTGTISGYANSTTYKVSAVTGTTPSVIGFTLINTDNTAISTAAGTTTGLTFKVTGYGGIIGGEDYYIHSTVGSAFIRLSSTIGGLPVPLTAGSGALTMVPRTVLTTTFNSQTVSAGTALTLTTNVQGVPTPFTVDADTTKIRIIEVWKQPYSDVVFLKYLGEFA